MSKEEFLRILREKLSILDEKEMEDILNEYEQHIDMKTAGAMTEEEAIADFGNLDGVLRRIFWKPIMCVRIMRRRVRRPAPERGNV